MPDGMTDVEAHAYLDDHGWMPIAMGGSVVWGRSAANDPFTLDGLLLTLWAAVALQEQPSTADSVPSDAA